MAGFAVVAGGVVGVVTGGVVGVVAGGVVGVVAGGVVGVVAGGVVGVVDGGVVGVDGSGSDDAGCDPDADGSAADGCEVVDDEDLQAARTSSAARQSLVMPMVSHRVPPFTRSGTILPCASSASISRKRS
jgi:hypothetical protein